MLKKMMSNVSSKRLSEERLYELALSELEDGTVRKGIWAKALVASEGDEKKAGAIYVKLRVESLVDEAVVLKARLEALEIEQNLNRRPKNDEITLRVNSEVEEVESGSPGPIEIIGAFLIIMIFLVPIMMIILGDK